ncbi:hypothetical protein CE91St41_02830 [Oscillospiraceae bacterium]|nr:hypothetical protein CE91St40_02830 [Oscillospiraceae bacterium]BDF73394.1 hypothetical protein CE91St41_02830 [Oscillospiraceae bacterium]
MNQTYLRGSLFYADLGDGIGSEQKGFRPVVIIQNNIGNKHSPTVIVAAISSKTSSKAKLPTHYCIGTESGLECPSIVLLEQLRTIDKRRVGDYIGHLTINQMRELNHALAISIGLIEPIPNKLTLCLCDACANDFRGTGAFLLRRVNHQQAEKDTCTYCNQHKGYVYEVEGKVRG